MGPVCQIAFQIESAKCVQGHCPDKDRQSRAAPLRKGVHHFVSNSKIHLVLGSCYLTARFPNISACGQVPTQRSKDNFHVSFLFPAWEPSCPQTLPLTPPKLSLPSILYTPSYLLHFLCVCHLTIVIVKKKFHFQDIRTSCYPTGLLVSLHFSWSYFDQCTGLLYDCTHVSVLQCLFQI